MWDLGRKYQISLFYPHQQLWRLYIAHRWMDFASLEPLRLIEALAWIEELFLEHISTLRGNCLLFSFLSSKDDEEGF